MKDQNERERRKKGKMVNKGKKKKEGWMKNKENEKRENYKINSERKKSGESENKEIVKRFEKRRQFKCIKKRNKE